MHTSMKTNPLQAKKHQFNSVDPLNPSRNGKMPVMNFRLPPAPQSGVFSPIHLKLSKEMILKMLSSSTDEAVLEINHGQASLTFEDSKVEGKLNGTMLGFSIPDSSSPFMARTSIAFNNPIVKLNASQGTGQGNSRAPYSVSPPGNPKPVNFKQVPILSNKSKPLPIAPTKPASKHSPIVSEQTSNSKLAKPTNQIHPTSTPTPRFIPVSTPTVPIASSKPLNHSAKPLSVNPQQRIIPTRPKHFAPKPRNPTPTSLKITKKNQDLPQKPKEMRRYLTPSKTLSNPAQIATPNPVHKPRQELPTSLSIDSSELNPHSGMNLSSSKKPNGILTLGSKKRTILQSLPPSKRPKFRPFKLDLQTN